MIAPARRKDKRFVIMKESSVPAPATPASVCVESGILLQSGMVAVGRQDSALKTGVVAHAAE